MVVPHGVRGPCKSTTCLVRQKVEAAPRECVVVKNCSNMMLLPLKSMRTKESKKGVLWDHGRDRRVVERASCIALGDYCPQFDSTTNEREHDWYVALALLSFRH
jgi:hypothetical protein